MKLQDSFEFEEWWWLYVTHLLKQAILSMHISLLMTPVIYWSTLKCYLLVQTYQGYATWFLFKKFVT